MNKGFDSKVQVRCGHKRALVRGVGINDAEYVITQVINGKRVHCPFYTRWSSMLERCYSHKLQETRPTYIGCSVHKDWLKFSIFKSWMEQQPWDGNQLDKDLLIKGNKVYSEETCVFVSQRVNSFLLEGENSRRLLPIGVNLHQGKYQANCRDNNTLVFLGYYDTPDLAHLAWFNYKAKLAKKLASEQTDPRVAEALLSRFTKAIYESTNSQLLNN